ncbi:MAG: hypothetical protein ABFD96_08310, partial [Armatimonadia bacterium]
MASGSMLYAGSPYRRHGFTLGKMICLYIALLAAAVGSFGAGEAVGAPAQEKQAIVQDGERMVQTRVSDRWAGAPICLSANNMSVATGQPSLVLMSSGSTHIPVWSL